MNKTAEKMLGIWMDHSSAHIIECKVGEMETELITSNFTQAEKQYSLSKSEHLLHNKEQQHQAAYYKQLGDLIKTYDNVILFGPTDAKTELLNILKADLGFEKIKIETAQADKMTENQEHAFVRAFFSKN